MRTTEAEPTAAEWELAVLKELDANPHVKFSDFHTGIFVRGVAARVLPPADRPDENVNIAIWSLIRRGLIFWHSMTAALGNTSSMRGFG